MRDIINITESAIPDPSSLMLEVKKVYDENQGDSPDFSKDHFVQVVNMLDQHVGIFDPLGFKVFRAEYRPKGDSYHSVGPYWAWHYNSAMAFDTDYAMEFHGVEYEELDLVIFTAKVNIKDVNLPATIAKNMISYEEREITLVDGATVKINTVEIDRDETSVNITAHVLDSGKW